VVTKLTCRKEIHREIVRADKSCKVAPRHCLNGNRRFETMGLSQFQGSKHPFHIRGFFEPLKIRPPQRHEASITDHLVTHRHIPQVRTPQLHRCERPTTVQSCKCLLLVQFDNYCDPFYFPKP